MNKKMSYVSRQPMVPGLGPPMGYGFAPMGSMVPMGMMNSNVMRNNAGSMRDRPSKKLVPQEIPKDGDHEKHPVTTVFVGNISERAPDNMVKQMLTRCGTVLSWKRVQGASGKLQAFGFCEYDNPEATMRCIRLLNEWMIADKKIVVKVDAKTKNLIEEYKAKKKEKRQREKEKKKEKNGEDEKEEAEIDSDDDALDDFTLREDRVAKAGLDCIMREYHDELKRDPLPADEDQRRRKPKDEKEMGLDDLEMEDDKKDLINREIKFFRDSHKILGEWQAPLLHTLRIC